MDEIWVHWWTKNNGHRALHHLKHHFIAGETVCGEKVPPQAQQVPAPLTEFDRKCCRHCWRRRDDR